MCLAVLDDLALAGLDHLSYLSGLEVAVIRCEVTEYSASHW